jgi:hypothetical protein
MELITPIPLPANDPQHPMDIDLSQYRASIFEPDTPLQKYLFGLHLSIGAVAWAKKFQAWWMLDLIGAAQQKPKVEACAFQVWKITVDGLDTDEAHISCRPVDKTQITYSHISKPTSFPPEEHVYNTLFVIHTGQYRVVLLPSEY